MTTTINYFHTGKMKFKNGVLFVEYNPRTLIDENVLYGQILCGQNITNNKKFFMLVDLRNVIDVTDEAMALAASNASPEYVKAIAIVTKNGLDHTKAKLYSVFDRPNIRSKGFLNTEEAKSWLESLEQEDCLRKAS